MHCKHGKKAYYKISEKTCKFSRLLRQDRDQDRDQDQDIFLKTKTNTLAARLRPRPWLQVQDQEIKNWSSRSIETMTWPRGLHHWCARACVYTGKFTSFRNNYYDSGDCIVQKF